MVNVSVCIGSSCHLKGSYNVISELQKLVEEYELGKRVDISAVFCLGHCSSAISVKVNDEEVIGVSNDGVREFFEKSVLPIAKK
jgi:NADH:ubiquinone oxidoreductase subunit E